MLLYRVLWEKIAEINDLLDQWSILFLNDSYQLTLQIVGASLYGMQWEIR